MKIGKHEIFERSVLKTTLKMEIQLVSISIFNNFSWKPRNFHTLD